MTILKLLNCLLVSLCFLSFTTLKSVLGESIPSPSTKCNVVDCGCQFTNSTGTYEITMKNISPNDPFNVTPSGSQWTYSIDPCYVFTQTKDCTDVTMCQTGESGGSFPIAGEAIDDFGSFVDELTPIRVTYQARLGQDETKRQMIIMLKCGTLALPDDVDQSGADPIKYTLDITAPGGCPKKVEQHESSGNGGLSAGSALVIAFFVVLVVYLVAGILFMKYRRGATGKEVIPNVEFWSSLPGLIKDGCVFFGKKMKELCERCCQREGYSEI